MIIHQVCNWIDAHQNMISFLVVVFCCILTAVFSRKTNHLYFGIICLSVYSCLVLHITVFLRTGTNASPNLDLLWSYKAVIKGMHGMISQIYLNTMLFIPIGLFTVCIFQQPILHNALVSILLGVLFSLFIELLQLVFHKGLFELDDILNNSIGDFIGVEIETIVWKCRANFAGRRYSLTLTK